MDELNTVLLEGVLAVFVEAAARGVEPGAIQLQEGSPEFKKLLGEYLQEVERRRCELNGGAG